MDLKEWTQTIARDTATQPIMWEDLKYDAAFDGVQFHHDLFALEPEAKKVLLQQMGMPGSYFARCPKELQEENLNYWLRTNRDEIQLITTDHHVIGFLDTNQPFIPIQTILDEVADAIGEKTEVRRGNKNGSVITAEINLPGREFIIGDEIGRAHV